MVKNGVDSKFTHSITMKLKKKKKGNKTLTCFRFLHSLLYLFLTITASSGIINDVASCMINYPLDIVKIFLAWAYVKVVIFLYFDYPLTY